MYIPKEPEEIENEQVEPEDLESLRGALNEERVKAENHLQNWQRVQADFINYKRRSDQEKEETKKFANSVLICNLLPVLDDLERALSSIPPHLVKLPWVEGVKLIERKFHGVLDSQGVKPIKVKGKPFDPNLHEAAISIAGREGIVVKELKKGYKLHDKIIRPATVAVGNGVVDRKQKK
ncbi:MAG: nucleotide exchange factor GrpE [Dehalococcoidia bacterium]|nr:MAG: nucleotide exchange factor GrpE [Dehalococcoidia bacterium]